MRINRDVLLTSILKHQLVFLKLLDYIDSHEGSLELPESLYLRLYNNDICRADDENSALFLSVETLVENGFFIHHDKSAGIITIERVLVDLLRFIDTTRAKELNNADFEQMRSQLSSAVNYITSNALNSQAHSDGIVTFNNLMSQIHSKIKENVYKLTIQVEALATEYKEYNQGEKKVNVINLYNSVSELYHRFVLPCYEFINPTMEMVNTSSFSKTINELIGYFNEESVEYQAIANRIHARKISITSYYKDIGQLVKKLDRFSNHLEKDRNNYLSIEDNYNKLMESIALLRHGRRKNKYLTPQSKFFSSHHSLDGITTHKQKYKAKLKWTENSSRLRFEAYLEAINNQIVKHSSTDLKPISLKDRPHQDKQLKRYLKDFSLVDVIYGLEDFLTMYKGNIYRVQGIPKKILKDQQHYFEYLPIEYKKEV